MIDRRRVLLAGSALSFLPLAQVWAQTLPDQPTPEAYRTGEAAKLHALMNEWMRRSLRRSPEFATQLGVDKGENAEMKSHLSDYSLAQVRRDEAETLRRLQELKALDRSQLSGQPAVHYDTLMFGQQLSADAIARFDLAAGGPTYVYGLSQLGGSYQQTPDFLDNAHTIENAADAEAYLSRLNEWGRVLDQEIEVVRHDVNLGMIPPDFALDKALVQIKALQANTVETSPLVLSVVRRTREKNIPGDWQARAGQIWTSRIQPALARQTALLTEMRARAVHDAGIWRRPDGEALYAISLRNSNTTNMSADEIHRVGLDMLERLHAQADVLMKKQGYTQGTVGERYRAMAEDPKFHYPNTDEGKEKLLADLNKQMVVVTAKLPAYFSRLPKTPLEIKRVPKFIEAGAPGGYYNTGSLDGTRPGIYWINLRDTKETPSWTLPTLTYHEGAPGHHLQLSLQQESQVPLLMKTVGYSAHAEGWGLYSEELAVEMGMYENDPVGQIGMLHDAAFRAVRLVVDTGMHAKRWSREQAIKFYVDSIGDPEPAAITEIERYAVWPGQATSYMIGKIKIMELRDRMRRALGDRFDIKRFHDVVLLNGSMPLELLERLVDDDIKAQRA
jgi:uncharacterized protein (DUF885 family)